MILMILLTGTDKTIKACKYCGNNPALRDNGYFYEIAYDTAINLLKQITGKLQAN